MKFFKSVEHLRVASSLGSSIKEVRPEEERVDLAESVLPPMEGMGVVQL